MRPKDKVRGEALEKTLIKFSQNHHPLPGIDDEKCRKTFVEQLVESLRRIEYVHLILENDHSDAPADPQNLAFDPLVAAVIQKRRGQLEEAFWLVFLSTHCGKNRKVGWRLARLIYSGLDDGIWTWNRVSTRPERFRSWLKTSEVRLKPDGKCGFGNHRKYETLRDDAPRSTAAVVSSYVAWVNRFKSHTQLFRQAEIQSAGDPKKAFDELYQSVKQVTSFGRTGGFDYLTMVGKLDLAKIEPGIPYMTGASGPLKGAKRLFAGKTGALLAPKKLDQLVVGLGLDLGIGMQAMEDALCNWNKEPDRFIRFRG